MTNRYAGLAVPFSRPIVISMVEIVAVRPAAVFDAASEGLHDVHAEPADTALLDWQIEARRRGVQRVIGDPVIVDVDGENVVVQRKRDVDLSALVSSYPWTITLMTASSSTRRTLNMSSSDMAFARQNSSRSTSIREISLR